MKTTKLIGALGIIALILAAGPGAVAGSHTWEVWEVFSNADGTVQFIELKEFNGDVAEWALHLHMVTSNPSGRSSGSLTDVTGNTAFKFWLLGTAAFAALPGAPTPDFIIPSGFISVATDSRVDYSGTPLNYSASWTAGTLPTDGIHSYTKTATHSALSVAVNSPTNYAGVTGSIDASAPPPGVPDGVTGTPLTVSKTTADGSTLSLTWDAATCSDTSDHQILYGQKSGFPAVPGGTYTLQGGTCNIGSTTPYSWVGTPSAVDGSGLTWFLVVTKNGSGVEGPWGDYDALDHERNGTGTNGSSGVCSTTDKKLTSVCGH